jgi:hypothetical protein
LIDIYYIVERFGPGEGRHRIWGQAVRFGSGTWAIQERSTGRMHLYAYDPLVSELDPDLLHDLILVRQTSVPDPEADLRAMERDTYPDGTPFASLAEASRFREQERND